MPKKDDLIAEIERWLERNDNQKARLASSLGYSSSNVIWQWIHKNRVPEFRKEDVRKFLKVRRP